MSYNNKYLSVVIPAAGMGKRMNSNINKQFILLNEKPILSHTIEKFENLQYIDEIIIITREDEIEMCKRDIVDKYEFKKVTSIVKGGSERQDSVYNGIKAVNSKCDIVLIHDGARPFVKENSIIDGIKGAIEYGACTVGVKVKDTIKVVDSNEYITNTPDRSTLWAVQTPQCFLYDTLLKAYELGIKDRAIVTDDSMLVERLGIKVKMVMGSYDNIKITTPEDLEIGKAILKRL